MDELDNTHPKRNEGLFFYCVLDRQGGASFFSSWRTLFDNWKTDHFIWVHLNHRSPAVQKWLREESGVPSVVAESMLEEDVRPREYTHEDGLLLLLRGVNLKEGSVPEDMVSMRLWITKNRIITLRFRENMTTKSIQDELITQKGFRTPSGFLLKMLDNMVTPIDSSIDEIDAQLDEIEDGLLLARKEMTLLPTIHIRQRIAHFRKHLAPQRDLLGKLFHEHLSWLDERDSLFIREEADTAIRYIEELDFLRERCTIIQEEVNNALSYTMNSRIYLLAIATVIFMPLTLMTGLLGINVNGIPYSDSKYAFFGVCGLLGVMAFFLFRLLKRKRWL